MILMTLIAALSFKREAKRNPKVIYDWMDMIY
jgi:hypothetical protein